MLNVPRCIRTLVVAFLLHAAVVNAFEGTSYADENAILGVTESTYVDLDLLISTVDEASTLEKDYKAYASQQQREEQEQLEQQQQQQQQQEQLEEEEEGSSDEEVSLDSGRHLLAAPPRRTPSQKRMPTQKAGVKRTPSKKHAPTRKRSITPSRKRARTATSKRGQTQTPFHKRTPTKKHGQASVKRTPSRKHAVKRTPSRKPTPTATVPYRPLPTRPPWNSFAPLTVRYTLGTPEYVYYAAASDPHYPDVAVTGLRLHNGEFRCYSGKGRADLIVAGPKLGQVLQPKQRLNFVFNPRVTRYWTHVLEGIWQDPVTHVLHAFLHLELTTGDPTGTWINGVVAYVRSTDNGLTFQPAAPMPRDYVITSAGPIVNNRKNVGIGKNWVIQVGNYLMHYFIDFWADGPDGQPMEYGHCMARSTLACAGSRAECWVKWYRGRFDPTQTGRGGRCTQVPHLYATSISRVYLRNADRYIYFGIPDSVDTWASVSNDGVHWHSLVGVHNTASADWLPKTVYRNWNLFYCSAMDDENLQTWMYCGVVTEETEGRRAIARWPITFNRGYNLGCSGRVTIQRWLRRGNARYPEERITWQPMDERVWRKGDVLGYTSVCQGDWLITLWDCEIPEGFRKPHVITRSMSECNALGGVPYSTYGSARIIPQRGLTPLYRCQRSNRTWIHSTGRPCPRSPQLIGYIYPPGGSEGDWMDVSLPY